MIKYYRLNDVMTTEDLKAIGAPQHSTRVHIAWDHSKHGHVCVMAKKTGEFRSPKRGEWYISGAQPVAYRAPNGMTTEHHIAKPVIVRKVSGYEEV